MDLFRKNLKRILKKKGLNQEALARKMKRSPSAVSKLVTNQRPRWTTIENLVKVLEVKFWEFFIDEDAEDIGPLSHDEVMLVLDFREVAKEKDGKRSNALLESAKALAKRT